MNRFLKQITLIVIVVLIAAMGLTACTQSYGSTGEPAPIESQAPVSSQAETITADIDGDDQRTDFDVSEANIIEFKGDGIDITGAGAAANGTALVISLPGIYILSGALIDGQVIVDSEPDGTVFLVFNGVDISSSNSAPIYIVNSDKTVISLMEGTINKLSDGTNRVFADPEDEEPDSVLFSEDDLTINGKGSLVIEAAYNHGINCKDDLIIMDADIEVNAVSDGIKGKDSITVSGAILNIASSGDGMQSNNDTDAEKGYILIESGTIVIESENDGIQAENNLYVMDGNINITSGGGMQNPVVSMAVNEQEKDMLVTVEETTSTKGLKAGVNLIVSGGNITVDSHDDSVHSNDGITITGGELILSTDDDGIHGDNEVVIEGGNIDITNCYEGVEGKVVNINGGSLWINASDDGINLSDGTAVQGNMRMMPQSPMGVSNGIAIYINGGYIFIKSNGDSVDSNGSIEMNGGTLIANGSTSPTNGALDSDGEFIANGGIIVATSSSGMAEAPGENSGQNSLLYIFDKVMEAGTIIYIESEDGEQILAYEPEKEYQALAFSSPDLKNGETYTIHVGGDVNGNETNGLYEAGKYNGGTEIGNFTITNILTVVGEQMGMGPGGQRPGGINPGPVRRP